jgi:hypothetical protein
MKKYKLTWKDLSLNDFKVYFFSLFKAFIPKSKIKNLDELEEVYPNQVCLGIPSYAL